MCISRKYVTAVVNLFDLLGAVVQENAREARRAFLDSSAEGVVLEGDGASAGYDGLGQAVLEVPGVGFAGGIGEGIAVCVIRVAAARSRGQFVRRVVAVGRHSG